MLSERMLSVVVRETSKRYLNLKPTDAEVLPVAVPGQAYMLYMHVPFCERLCPYCSFNRFPFEECKATRYFKNMRAEMLMLKDLGYDFESLYIGGGTPTIMIDELCETIDLAKETFSIKEVSSETNPNHLTVPYLEKLKGRVDRLSVGVQSFDNGLLKQMDRYDKYGSAEEILERIRVAAPYFKSMNVDMIFNFPSQTIDMLINDVEKVIESGASQATFYPLMASPSVAKSLARTVGKVDYSREQRYYEVIDELLCGGEHPLYDHSSAWTFNRLSASSGTDENSTDMIDEYVVNYEEYPAVGSGGITYLGGRLFVNTFSVLDYNDILESGKMSLMASTEFKKRERMRYRFMMQLFGLRLDKKQFKADFGCSIEAGLPVEMAFMAANGAFATNTEDELTLTRKGRYLMVVMMREFFIGVNKLRDQARAALSGEEAVLQFGE